MKRTLSLEAQDAVAYLAKQGFMPASALPSRGGVHPLAVLGLGPDARFPEVKQAFVTRLRQFPPERHPEEFIMIFDAYNALKRHFISLAQRENADDDEPLVRTSKRTRFAPPLGSAEAAAQCAGFGCGSAGSGGYFAACASVGGASAAVIAVDTSGVAHVEASRAGSAAVVGNNGFTGLFPAAATSAAGLGIAGAVASAPLPCSVQHAGFGAPFGGVAQQQSQVLGGCGAAAGGENAMCIG
jgi:hypothetical protein